MTLYREDDRPLHCGWTDPRDRLNWHVHSYRDESGEMISFRRSGTETEYRARNWFGRSCARLEDIELAQLLNVALWGWQDT